MATTDDPQPGIFDSLSRSLIGDAAADRLEASAGEMAKARQAAIRTMEARALMWQMLSAVVAVLALTVMVAIPVVLAIAIDRW
jgi:hypothetical protein